MSQRHILAHSISQRDETGPGKSTSRACFFSTRLLSTWTHVGFEERDDLGLSGFPASDREAEYFERIVTHIEVVVINFKVTVHDY